MFLSRHLPFGKLEKNVEEILHQRLSEELLLSDQSSFNFEKNVSPLCSSQQAAKLCDPVAGGDEGISTDLKKLPVGVTAVKQERGNGIICMGCQKRPRSNWYWAWALLTRWRAFRRSQRVDRYLEQEGRRQQIRVLMLGTTPWTCSSWLQRIAKQEVTYCDFQPTWSILEQPSIFLQRKKWLHWYDNITSIIITIDIRDYAYLLEEDTTVTRLQESMTAWESYANSRFFQSARFALCFIKTAEFGDMIATEPVSKYFKDCSDDLSLPEDAKEYLGQRFLMLDRSHDLADVKVFYIADLPKQEDLLAVQHFFLHGSSRS